MRFSARGLMLLLALALAGCGGDVANVTSGTQPATSTNAPAASAAPQCGGTDSSVTDKGNPDDFNEGASVAGTTSADGLKIVDLRQGTGTAVQNGSCVTVQYTGWLTDGTKFDSSRDRVGGFQFALPGQVIGGWNEGIPGMKVGGRRRLVIPPSLGYGAQAQGPIPANATLVFIVEVVKAT